jgi:hypothetical protein
MRIRPRPNSRPEPLLVEANGSHYCARCLTSTTAHSPSCPGCTTSFTGAGSYDRLEGPPPSLEFAFLFARSPQPAGPVSAYSALC